MEDLTNRMKDGCQVPDLAMPKGEPAAFGKYAHKRKKFLKENRKILYTYLLTNGTLNQHLLELQKEAQEKEGLLTSQIAKEQGVDEQLKRDDWIQYIGMMNNITKQAEEIVLAQLIYK